MSYLVHLNLLNKKEKKKQLILGLILNFMVLVIIYYCSSIKKKTQKNKNPVKFKVLILISMLNAVH